MNVRLIGAAAIASLALAGCATTSPNYGYGSPTPASSSASACYDCGTVERIETVVQGSTAPSATGAVLGGIVGAVAGHEISAHTGGSKGNQNVATVAGAAAGAVAGNAIQKKRGVYNVYVRMNNGNVVTVTQSDLGGIREGSYVRVYNGRASLR